MGYRGWAQTVISESDGAQGILLIFPPVSVFGFGGRIYPHCCVSSGEAAAKLVHNISGALMSWGLDPEIWSLGLRGPGGRVTQVWKQAMG